MPRVCGCSRLRPFAYGFEPQHRWDIGTVHAAADLTVADGREVLLDGAVGQVLAVQVRNEKENDLFGAGNAARPESSQNERYHPTPDL